MSAIVGKGHGDKHDWVYEKSNDSHNSFYHCARCGADFCHSYNWIPDIFEAMKKQGVPLECKAAK